MNFIACTIVIRRGKQNVKDRDSVVFQQKIESYTFSQSSLSLAATFASHKDAITLHLRWPDGYKLKKRYYFFSKFEEGLQVLSTDSTIIINNCPEDILIGVLTCIYKRGIINVRFGVSVPLKNTEAHEQLLMVGQMYFDLRHGDSIMTAIGIYDEVIRYCPKYTSAYAKRAHAYQCLAEPEKAYQDIMFALSLQESDGLKVDAYNIKAEIDIKHGEYYVAMMELERALLLAPQHLETYFNLATLYRKDDKWDLAEAAYATILKMDPENVRALYEHAVLGLTQYQSHINHMDLIVVKERFLKAKHYGERKRTSISSRLLSQIELSYAEVCRELGLYQDARRGFLAVIKLQPSHANSYLQIAEIEYSEKRYAQAIPWLLKAISYHKNYDRAYHSLSCVYHQLEKYDEEINCLKKAIEINTNYYFYYYDLASCYTRLKHFREATQLFQQGAKLQFSRDKSDSLATILDLISFWQKPGQVMNERLSDLYESFMRELIRRGRLGDALQLFQPLIASHPHNKAAWHFERGRIYQTLNHCHAALSDFSEAFKLSPNNDHYKRTLISTCLSYVKRLDVNVDSVLIIEATKALLVLVPHHLEALHIIAGAYFYQSSYEKAIFYYTLMLNDEPLLDTFIARSLAYLKLNRVDDAIDDWERALRLGYKGESVNKIFFGVVFQRGYDYYHKCFFKEAVHDFDLLIQYNLANSYVYELAGSCYATFNQHPKVLDYSQKAVVGSRDPAAVYNNIGRAMRALGQQGNAFIYYQKAIQLKPELAVAHFNCGNIRCGEGEFLDAIQCYLTAIQYGLKDAEVFYSLGEVYSYVGQYHEAIEFLKKSQQMSESIEASYTLGKAYEAIADYVKAMDCYQTVIRLDHDFLPAYLRSAKIYQLQHQYLSANQVIRRIENHLKRKYSNGEIKDSSDLDILNQVNLFKAQLSSQLKASDKTLSTSTMFSHKKQGQRERGQHTYYPDQRRHGLPASK